MKYLKRTIAAFAMAIFPFHSYINGCGGEYFQYMDYYNLFDQLLLENKSLRPFLVTLDAAFYNETESGTNKSYELPDENLNAWMAFFKKNNLLQNMSREQFKTLLYSTPNEALKQPMCAYVVALNKSDIGKKVLAYLQYAKELEPYAQLANDDGWYNGRAASPSIEAYNRYKNKGLELYKNCQYDELKLRYGYQLVRLAHYMRTKNNEAILMYNQYVKPLRREHYIYYAALEQTAGALYNIGKLANANYLYSRVFDHSDCRKEASYVSFRIQNGVDWNEAMTWCKDNREKAAMYALRGYNNFSNELEEAENILKILPESPYIKLLAIRYINKLERNVLSRYYNLDKDGNTISLFMHPDEEVFAEYQRAQKVIKEVMNDPKTGDKDFWAIYHAHLSFLCKDYKQAASFIEAVNTTKPNLLKQKNRTQFGIYLAQLQSIGKEEEEKVRKYLQANNADKDFTNEIVGHLYKIQGDYGKAFLIHNPIENLQQNPNREIINSLISDHQEDKDQSKLITLYELKGTHFLRMNQFEEAAKWFAKVPESYEVTHYTYDYEAEKYVPDNSPNQFNGYSEISPLIFSNGFKRLFSVPASSQLNDTMYEQYAYLNKEHNKETLTAALIQLEKESRMMTEKGAQAAYLLANYYFNISPTGYYRNIPTYASDNSYMYMYYSNDQKSVIPDYSKSYNYRNFTSESMTINNMNKALALYEQAFAYFTDREWKARALFMATSCWMDLYAENWWSNTLAKKSEDDSSTTEEVNAYKEKHIDFNFYKLAKNYGDTHFFKQAMHECKYFEYYVKNEL